MNDEDLAKRIQKHTLLELLRRYDQMEDLKSNWRSCRKLRAWGCVCFEKRYRRIKEEASKIKNNQ